LRLVSTHSARCVRRICFLVLRIEWSLESFAAP
jgi:hypothetical protein